MCACVHMRMCAHTCVCNASAFYLQRAWHNNLQAFPSVILSVMTIMIRAIPITRTNLIPKGFCFAHVCAQVSMSAERELTEIVAENALHVCMDAHV